MDPSRAHPKRIRLDEPVRQAQGAPPSPSPSDITSDSSPFEDSDVESSMDSTSEEEEDSEEDFDDSGDSDDATSTSHLRDDFLRPGRQAANATPSDTGIPSPASGASLPPGDIDSFSTENRRTRTGPGHLPATLSQTLNKGKLISARLDSLLRDFKASNAELDGLKKQGRLDEVAIDKVDEGEAYIEMNLGLGVLEEQRGDASSDEEDEDEDTGEEVGKNLEGPKETHFLEKLMDVSGKKRKAMVQAVDDAG
ncbi:hypothetical protein BDZ85DRAFT_258181 [Elsinoe ampelina]|uniref:Uncharacterized protein n=1 Tax=Elsinoe ampelina TaxID=302913 RepID=A0A6A6GKD0_9PEZI|nr:hypothetical protein BDZ85DRAFT_258181 [Elsinoe ampelina]